MKKSLILSVFFLSVNAYGLVDYSEPIESSSDEKLKARSFQKMPTKNSSSQSRALVWKADFSFTGHYESMEIEGQKYGVLNLSTHIQTPVNIYFDASYWSASGDAGSENGNPVLSLGFNWLRFGSPQDEARLNFYGGAKLSSSSRLGSSRTDKIIGLETTKRFGTFGLGVGYELAMVGTPKNGEEKRIGNISRIVVSSGWMVSSDIQFEVEVENFTINPNKDLSSTKRLSEKVSFSTLSPKVNLGLAPAINLEMGARFRMKKPKADADLMAARVFDLHGANANSLFAGLNFTI